MTLRSTRIQGQPAWYRPLRYLMALSFKCWLLVRTKGHSIEDAQPLTTLKKLEELFGIPAPSSLTPPSAH